MRCIISIFVERVYSGRRLKKRMRPGFGIGK
jgi:hypothetical protein